MAEVNTYSNPPIYPNKLTSKPTQEIKYTFKEFKSGEILTEASLDDISSGLTSCVNALNWIITNWNSLKGEKGDPGVAGKDGTNGQDGASLTFNSLTADQKKQLIPVYGTNFTLNDADIDKIVAKLYDKIIAENMLWNVQIVSSTPSSPKENTLYLYKQ